MSFNCLANATGAGRHQLMPAQLPRASPWVQPADPASRLHQGRRSIATLFQSQSRHARRWWSSRGEPGASSQALWLLVQSWGKPTSGGSFCGCPDPLSSSRASAQPSCSQKALPGGCSPHTALPGTHHPLHLLGHLVATQVVVEGALGPPVWWVVPNGVGSLAIHLGNHGLLFFLGEQHRCISLWPGPTRWAPVWSFSFLPGAWPDAQGLRQLLLSSLQSLEPRSLLRS